MSPLALTLSALAIFAVAVGIAVWRWRAPKKRTPISALRVGKTRDAVVLRLMDFGAFVDIGAEKDALLHFNDIAWEYFKNPSEVLRKGQKLKVQVLVADTEEGKIAVGRKQLLPHPLVEKADQFKIGSRHRAAVINRSDGGGITVTVGDVVGFVPKHQIGHRKAPEVGDKISAYVTKIEPAAGKLTLSLKPPKEELVADFAKKHKKGDIIDGKVESVHNELGIFVGLDGGASGLIHTDHISHGDCESARLSYLPGQTIKVKILNIYKDKIPLGLKQLWADEEEEKQAKAAEAARREEEGAKAAEAEIAKENAERKRRARIAKNKKLLAPFEKGSNHDGEIIKVTETHCRVRLSPEIGGTIGKAQMRADGKNTAPPAGFVRVGDKVRVKVMAVYVDVREINLRLLFNITRFAPGGVHDGEVIEVAETYCRVRLSPEIGGTIKKAQMRADGKNTAPPAEIVNIGDKVKVAVLAAANAETGRIVLRLRLMDDEAVRALDENKKLLAPFAPGSVHEGEVVGVKPIFCLVRLSPEVMAALHKSKMSAAGEAAPDEIVAVGDKVKVEILTVDVFKMRAESRLREVLEKVCPPAGTSEAKPAQQAVAPDEAPTGDAAAESIIGEKTPPPAAADSAEPTKPALAQIETATQTDDETPSPSAADDGDAHTAESKPALAQIETAAPQTADAPMAAEKETPANGDKPALAQIETTPQADDETPSPSAADDGDAHAAESKPTLAQIETAAPQTTDDASADGKNQPQTAKNPLPGGE